VSIGSTVGFPTNQISCPSTIPSIISGTFALTRTQIATNFTRYNYSDGIVSMEFIWFCQGAGTTHTFIANICTTPCISGFQMPFLVPSNIFGVSFPTVSQWCIDGILSPNTASPTCTFFQGQACGQFSAGSISYSTTVSISL